MITPIEIDSEDFFVTDRERNLMTMVIYGLHINPDPIYRKIPSKIVHEVSFGTRLSAQSHIKLTQLNVFRNTLNKSRLL